MLERGRRIFTFASIFFALLAVVRIAVGFGRSAATKKRERVDGRRSIETSRACMREAIRAGDASSYAAHFFEDALSITPSGTNLAGRIALERATRDSLEHARVIEAGIESTGLRAFGETVVEEGRFWLELDRPTGAVRSGGCYTAVWKRDRDRWKIAFESARAS